MQENGSQDLLETLILIMERYKLIHKFEVVGSKLPFYAASSILFSCIYVHSLHSKFRISKQSPICCLGHYLYKGQIYATEQMLMLPTVYTQAHTHTHIHTQTYELFRKNSCHS